MNEELKIVISAEINDLKKGCQDAQKEIESLNKNSKVSFEQFNKGFQKIGDAAKSGLKVAAGAIAGVATALVALGPATEEYRTSQAKLVSAFESVGSTADQAKTTYNDLYRVLGDSDVATEAANHLAQLTTNQKDLSEWTTICEGVYATFGDSLPIEGLTEAANETAKTGELTGSLADALNWAGVKEDDFTKKLEACNTEAEREKLIRETLSGLYDDAAGRYEKNAASILAQNEAQAKLTDSLAKVGEAMAPIMTALQELGADILADLAPYIEDFAAKHLPDIKEALSGVGDAIGKVIQWIADNWELVATIGGIVAGIAVAISAVSTALTIYNTVMAITTVVSAPVIGIIAAIVAAIALLVAGIVLAVQHWEEITTAVGNFASAVGEWFSGLWDKITQWISDIAQSISDWWSDVKEGFSNWWDGIVEGWTNFWTGVGDKVKAGVENVKNFFGDMKDNISEKVNNIKDSVSEKFNNIKDTISEKASNIKDTVSEKFNNIKDKITETITAAKEKTKENLQEIARAYEENGGGIQGTVAALKTAVTQTWENMTSTLDTLTNGKFSSITNTISTKLTSAKDKVVSIFNSIKESISTKIDAAKTAVSNAIDKIKGFFNFKFTWPKIPLPHFSISPAGWKIGDLLKGSIPSLSISWYAKGGVFDSPTLFSYGNGMLGGLGENGAEAVVPLEKNTQWLDRIAERLANQNTGPIVLQVDGKTFAQISCDSINQLTRQRGSIPLKLV